MKAKTYLTELAGLRGAAALCVVLYHVGNLTGIRPAILRSGGPTLDLFFLLSGFVLIHQYEKRRELQPESDLRATKRFYFTHFYVRRFFRIAPLYYALLLASFVEQPFLEKCNLYITRHSWVFTDIFRDVSWTNLVMHLSFAFGFLPHFSYHSGLPDWTVGLEIQFYLVFPFLILLILRFGYAATAALTLVLAVLGNLMFSPFVNSFPMSSFLPMKMHLFLLGMLIAATFHKRITVLAGGSCVALIPFLPLIEKIQRFKLGWLIGDMVMATILFLLTCSSGHVRKVLTPFRAMLNTGPMQMLGQISYAVYLVHLLIIPPIVALLLHVHWATALPGKPRFLLFSSAVMLVIFPVSLLLQRFIEQPGVGLGKRLLTPSVADAHPQFYRLRKSATSAATDAGSEA
ncbi:MAG TPA: acyltransferase [Terracidiphilus sp.]|nr:acyltransferase [Terracidiphilus sp.]